MMMTLLGFTIVVICGGVVTSQNHDVNLQTRKRRVEATTLIPPDPKVDNEGMQMLLTRLEGLCLEKLEFLITDTNRRFESLENKLSQTSSCPALPVVQSIENLETKVENLGKEFLANIQELMGVTTNLRSDVQAIKLNVSSLINVTRSLVDLSSNLELKQISNERLPNIEDLLTEPPTSRPLNVTLDLDNQYPKNCREVQDSGETASGIYTIQPEHAPKPFEVLCDLETRDGGWTVIQKRFDGSQDFYLMWYDYKRGFGNLTGEFWLGLENIHLLTGYGENELLIELGDFESKNKSAFYSQFTIGSEIEGYSLKVLGNYSGDAGDYLKYNVGRKFTTKDKDYDEYTDINCAQRFYGAWWYKGCSFSNLNGKYFDRGQIPERDYQSVHWFGFKAAWSSLKHTRMLVRPKVIIR